MCNFCNSGCGCHCGCGCSNTASTCNNGCGYQNGCGCNSGWFSGYQSICRDGCGNIRVRRNSRCNSCGCNQGCGYNYDYSSGCGNGYTNSTTNNNAGGFTCLSFCGNTGYTTANAASSLSAGDLYYARQYGLLGGSACPCSAGFDYTNYTQAT